jgi:hypothetical protein
MEIYNDFALKKEFSKIKKISDFSMHIPQVESMV